MHNTPIAIAIPGAVKKTLEKVAKRFRDHGYECYIVGGSVRDLILGREVYDWDFATDAHPDEVMRLFRKTVPTGIKHGTVTILVDDHSFEVTTYRSDGAYVDGRHPEEVTFSKTLKEDTARRDFTINGMAYDILEDRVVDLVNGMADLQAGIIRTIGNPRERFSEDGLRPLRACRFAAKLNFTIEEGTLAAIRDTLETAAMVSVERIRDELMKILEAEKPSIGIEYMRTTGLLKLVLPELDECYNVSQNKYHIYDVYYHSVYSCDSAPQGLPLIRLAALLHDIGKVRSRRPGPDGDHTFYNHEVIGAKIATRIMKRLKFSNEQITRVTNLVFNHMFHYTDEWTDGAVRRFIRKVGIENIDDLFILRLADRKGNGARRGVPTPIEQLKHRIARVIEEANAISVKDLDINGTILMEALGIAPGPMVGHILHELLEYILDNPEANTQELLLERAREIAAAERSEQ